MPKSLKILVIRFSSIGDIVLTTPVVRGLKKQLNAEVHYLTYSKYAELLNTNPYVDKVYTIQKSIHEIILELKQEKYDRIIDLHHNLRTSMLKFLLGVKAYSYNKLNIQKWILTTFRINILPNLHIVERYMKTVKTLGVEKDGLGLDYFLQEQDKVENLPEEYIAFVIGGTHHTKKLPLEKIIRICQKLQKQIILIGGTDDLKIGEKIAQTLPLVQNACGKYTLGQSAFMLQKAKFVITHDTGMMHIAAAFKKIIFSVWGNTVPSFGMTPYMPNIGSKIIEVKHLSCRPCTKIGYKKCPKGHFNCMQKMDENLFLDE